MIIEFTSLDEFREKVAGLYIDKGDWLKAKIEFDVYYPAEIPISKEFVENKIIEALNKEYVFRSGFIEKSFMIFVTPKGYYYVGSGQGVKQVFHVYIEWILEGDPAPLISLVVVFAGVIGTLVATYFVIYNFRGTLEIIKSSPTVAEVVKGVTTTASLGLLLIIAIILYMVLKK
jgi:hypothetical protein